jgi:hypothetical protein
MIGQLLEGPPFSRCRALSVTHVQESQFIVFLAGNRLP